MYALQDMMPGRKLIEVQGNEALFGRKMHQVF
jgi:hypothetical protein